MSEHLSTETWTIMDGKRSLLHIETSSDCEVAGRHICSINKKEERVATLIMLAPELLALAYAVYENNSPEQLKTSAASLIQRFNVSIK
jgi:hypothetical protein